MYLVCMQSTWQTGTWAGEGGSKLCILGGNVYVSRADMAIQKNKIAKGINIIFGISYPVLYVE